MRFFKLSVFSLLILALAFPLGVQAFTFNKNNLLNNSELMDWNSMSIGRVDGFLKKLGGFLSTVSAADHTGAVKSAAQIIVEASGRHRLSPKFFLIMIEKESGLVQSRKSDPYGLVDVALGFACPDGLGCSQEHKGFAHQVDAAGEKIRDGYLADLEKKGTTISGWGVGITKTTVDGIEVTPENEATAALYTYNPWVGKYGGGDQRWGANSLFVKLWQEWFSIRYPDGSLLRVRGEPGIWLIRNGQKHPFHSRSAFYSSYSMDYVIDIEAIELEPYPMGSPIKFPEFSLLQSPEGGVYLLANGEKRPIKSQETFRELGFHPEELIPVSLADLELYPDGEPVSPASSYPTGILLQSRETGGISYIENGQRHSIWSKEILRSRFKYRVWQQASQSEIDAYPLGDPVKFKDGEIVTSPNADGVYLISNGEKRAIPSPGVLNQLGLKWSNLIMTSDSALELHPTGEKLDYIEN
ncbi:MAG: hypothetical protein V1853_00610 [bacterium]